RDPDAVHDVEPRAEQPGAVEIGDERAAVAGEFLARDHRLSARLVDMRIDRQIVALCKGSAAFEELRRAALRRERRYRPVQPLAGGMAAKLRRQEIELPLGRERLGAQHLL